MANVKLKLRDNVDMAELLKGFEELETQYSLNDAPYGDAYIDIDKGTRIIWSYGYTGLLVDWLKEGYLEQVDIT